MYPPQDQENGSVISDKYMTGAINEDVANEISEHNRTVTQKKHGMKLWMTVILIAGELVGGGILTLPKAIDEAGILGIFMVVLLGAASCFAGMKLGKCWEIIMDKWPEFQKHVRDPYPEIANKCYGPKMRLFTRICVSITLFGGATVLMLIGSRLSQDLSQNLGHAFPYCYWVLIFGGCLAPIMWLGTPKDFWPVGMFALSTTALTVIIAFIALIAVKPAHTKETVEHSPIKITGVSLAFSTILFMYGGASTFPTIQNDMADKRKFSKAVFIGFWVMVCGMYLPIAFVSYFTLGNAAQPILLLSLQPIGVRNACEVFIIIHLLTAFFIVINPLCQDLEKIIGFPNKFGIKRVILRIGVMGAILFVAETVPHFDYILNIIGGSTITLLTFVFPSIFYLRLTSMKDEQGFQLTNKKVPLYEKILLVVIIIIGLVGGGVSTFYAIKKMTQPGSLVAPCYVSLAQADSG